MARPIKNNLTARTYRSSRTRTVRTRSCRSRPPKEAVHRLQGSTENEVKCSICLDTTRCRKMKTLRCKHAFHEKCVNTSLRRNPTCPLCRFPCPHYRTRNANISNSTLEDTLDDDEDEDPHDQLATAIMRYMLMFTFEMFDDLEGMEL